VHYPEDATLFYELEGKLRSATRKILDYYTKTFKVKKQEFHTLPWPYKHHVSVLHNVFKEKLKPAKKTVELENVVEYVNSLSVEDMSNLFKEPKQSSSPHKNKPEKTPVKDDDKNKEDKEEKKAE
jgi:hypothetical protein